MQRLGRSDYPRAFLALPQLKFLAAALRAVSLHAGNVRAQLVLTAAGPLRDVQLLAGHLDSNYIDGDTDAHTTACVSRICVFVSSSFWPDTL